MTLPENFTYAEVTSMSEAIKKATLVGFVSLNGSYPSFAVPIFRAQNITNADLSQVLSRDGRISAFEQLDLNGRTVTATAPVPAKAREEPITIFIQSETSVLVERKTALQKRLSSDHI